MTVAATIRESDSKVAVAPRRGVSIIQGFISHGQSHE
jgi:hypothetical protein